MLSFELGLLWPRFMAFAGAIIGMPFSLEGFAFFTEAIFLGIYLYGWERVSPRAHLLSGVAVSVSGALSALFVVLANAWMNAPAGFRLAGAGPRTCDPLAAMFSPGWAVEVGHVLLSSYLATAAAMAAVHALFLLRAPRSRFHRAALGIAMAFAVPAALLQPISGDFSARSVAVHQPAKLAALKGSSTPSAARRCVWAAGRTRRPNDPLRPGDPHGLSFLAFHDPNAEVRGLDSFPSRDGPNPRRCMWPSRSWWGPARCWRWWLSGGPVLWWGRRSAGRWMPYANEDRARPGPSSLRARSGFLALEAGWTVTEVGRQPWVVYGVIRTATR